MKYLNFAIFLLCMQLSLAIVNSTGILSTEKPYQEAWFTEIKTEAVENQNYDAGSVPMQLIQFGVDFVKALFIFITILARGVISLPYLLTNFGLLYPYTYFFSIPVYLLYAIAIFQVLSNRHTESMK